MYVAALEQTGTTSGRRAVACLATLASVAAGFVAFEAYNRSDIAWGFIIAALLLSIVWQWGVALDGPVIEGRSGPTTWPRLVLGLLLAAGGVGLVYLGTDGLLRDWRASFDTTWLAWVGGTALVACGLDLASGRWSRPLPGRVRWLIGVITALVVLAALFRLGTFYFFPAPYHVTQVEELQVGALGSDMLSGNRIRWEYLSQAWLGALGLTVGGQSLLAIRLPATILSFLKLIPFFLWMFWAVGPTGAVTASLLLAISGWDTTFARLATNQDVLIVATAFALLSGPARRGRPSAYVFLGLFAGYVMYEYVLYRPLALFAVVGAILVSLRDRHAHWAARLARPLLTIGLFLAMATPLALYLRGTGRTAEFFDGYGRARANQMYYSASDSWEEMLGKRFDRAVLATNLFFFRGPESPVTNPKAVPLTDPFTAALLVVGTGYAIAHPFRRLFGLTLAAAAVTVGGALVMTGNFDFVRAGSAVGYVFALAGFGAAGIGHALTLPGKPLTRRLAAAVLAGGVLYAASVNLRYLHFFVTAPEIRRAQFRDLAYLSWWIGNNVVDEERLLFVGPNFAYMMEPHDAAWLRGWKKQGRAVWDIQSALSEWALHPGPSILMINAGASSRDVRSYLDWLLPGIQFTVEPGPIGPDRDFLWARAETPPAELARKLERWVCQPVKIRAELLDRNGDVVETVYGTAGLIDPTQWPAAFQMALRRRGEEAQRMRVRFSGNFSVKEAGAYNFPVEIYPGTGTLAIDGTLVSYPPTATVRLEPGPHRAEIVSEYDPNANAPSFRLYWSGPDTAGAKQLLPFYAIGSERCEESSEAPIAAAPN